MIKKFYLTLQQLNQTDKLLVHLNSFASNPMNFTMPDTVGKGLPLFTMTPGIATPVLYSQVSRDARYCWEGVALIYYGTRHSNSCFILTVKQGCQILLEGVALIYYDTRHSHSSSILSTHRYAGMPDSIRKGLSLFAMTPA